MTPVTCHSFGHARHGCLAVVCCGVVWAGCVQSARIEPTSPGVAKSIFEAEAPECYFLPPSGPILFTVDFASDGTVKSLRPEHIYRADYFYSFAAGDAGIVPRDGPSNDEGPAVDCIAARLRTFKMAPGVPTTIEHVAAPHAAELPTNELVPFDRLALLAALERIDLSTCAGAAGPRRGEVLLITLPGGGVGAVRVIGPNRHDPVAECVNRLFKRVRTASYNGMPNWVLAPYSIAEPLRRP
jgi:hypothetical protein